NYLMFDAGAAAIAHDAGTEVQRYYGRYPADNGGCALYCFIGDVKDKKFFAGLGCANVVIAREHHQIFLPTSDRSRYPHNIVWLADYKDALGSAIWLLSRNRGQSEL